MQHLIAISLCVLLVGCLNLPQTVSGTPGEIAARFQTRVDPFDGMTVFSGPSIRKLPSTEFWLEGTRMPDNSTSARLRVKTRYFHAAPITPENQRNLVVDIARFNNFNQARDNHGNRFEVQQLKQQFDGCSQSFCYYREEFAILLPEGYLGEQRGVDMTIRATSTSGVYSDLPIPTNYVQAMLISLAGPEVGGR